MVSSIRFWLRAFGLIKGDTIEPIALYIFDSQCGRDPFLEDQNTLWLLHFLLVNSQIASIYTLLFIDFQREKREFTKTELQSFIKSRCARPDQRNVYNENTVKKDIGVLLKNYLAPNNLTVMEDFSSILIELGLLQRGRNDITKFNETKVESIAPEIILFALLTIRKDNDTLSYDELQTLSLTFCLPLNSLIEIIKKLESRFPNLLVYSENSGVRNVQFLQRLEPLEALDFYY